MSMTTTESYAGIVFVMSITIVWLAWRATTKDDQ